jgi:hypothetical protein
MNFSLREKLRPFYGPLYVVYVFVYLTAALGPTTIATAICRAGAPIGHIDPARCQELP